MSLGVSIPLPFSYFSLNQPLPLSAIPSPSCWSFCHDTTVDVSHPIVGRQVSLVVTLLEALLPRSLLFLLLGALHYQHELPTSQVSPNLSRQKQMGTKKSMNTRRSFLFFIIAIRGVVHNVLASNYFLVVLSLDDNVCVCYKYLGFMADTIFHCSTNSEDAISWPRLSSFVRIC